LNKADIVDFLSKSTNIAPNPDPAPAKVKLPKSSKSKSKTASDKEKFESASKSHAKEDGSTAGATATDETLVEEATESPEPIVDAQKPIILPDPAPPIPILSDEELAKECLGAKTGTCILALLPSSPDEVAAKAVGSLSEIAHRHKLHKRHLFPFYVLPFSNPGYAAIKKSLNVADTEIIAINARKAGYRVLPKSTATLTDADVSEDVIENWVDSIRLGEGAKQRFLRA
jgi:protein disulfide-isomerase A6